VEVDRLGRHLGSGGQLVREVLGWLELSAPEGEGSYTADVSLKRSLGHREGDARADGSKGRPGGRPVGRCVRGELRWTYPGKVLQADH
jgi:hypothetical protein